MRIEGSRGLESPKIIAVTLSWRLFLHIVKVIQGNGEFFTGTLVVCRAWRSILHGFSRCMHLWHTRNFRDATVG